MMRLLKIILKDSSQGHIFWEIWLPSFTWELVFDRKLTVIGMDKVAKIPWRNFGMVIAQNKARLRLIIRLILNCATCTCWKAWQGLGAILWLFSLAERASAYA